MDHKGVGMPAVGKPFRLAITGRTNSASIDETALILGKEKVVKALKKKWPDNLKRVYATAWYQYNKEKGK